MQDRVSPGTGGPGLRRPAGQAGEAGGYASAPGPLALADRQDLVPGMSQGSAQRRAGLVRSRTAVSGRGIWRVG